MSKAINIAALIIIGMWGYNIYRDQTQSYTLYRNSPLDPNARIHVASFNAHESREYNNDMCEFVQKFVQNNPETQARWWCEMGAATNLSK